MMYEIKGIRYAGGLLRFFVSIAMAWLGCIALVSCDQREIDGVEAEAEANITLTLCLKGTDENSTRAGASSNRLLSSRGDAGTENPDSEMENSIDFSRFHVVFYDVNGWSPAKHGAHSCGR